MEESGSRAAAVQRAGLKPGLYKSVRRSKLRHYKKHG